MAVSAAVALPSALLAHDQGWGFAAAAPPVVPAVAVVMPPPRTVSRPPVQWPLGSITISPAGMSLADGTSYRFTAYGYDTQGNAVTTPPTYAWTVLPGGAGGAITSAGVYTAPRTATGTDTVQVTANGVVSTMVVNDTPAGTLTADTDVGAPTVGGHYSATAAGFYALTGVGTDIGGTSDQFNFASTSLTGDGTIIARMTFQQNSDPAAKAGIMLRETTDGTSRDVSLLLTPAKTLQFADRATVGGATADAGDTTVAGMPVWEKVVRQGALFSAYVSADGTTWTQVGSTISLTMASTLSVGLAAASHHAGSTALADFDNVSVTVNTQPATGIYRLTTRGQQGLALDVEGFANADGTNVSLYTANQTSNQQWLVENEGDGSYKIYAYSGANSMQVLDDNGNGTANGTTVTTWTDNGGANQRWLFVPVGGGYYRIVPKLAAGTLQTLDMANGNNATIGSRTAIYGYWGGDNQVFKLDLPGAPAILPNAKKGFAGYPNEAAAIHAAWGYTWGGDEPTGLPAGTEFVPMAWGYYGNANNSFTNWLQYVKNEPGVKTLLGFNEPDSTSQSNLSVASALEGWGYMNTLGIPLGSPAAVHADDQWMQDFMSGAAAKGYRVDYVTIHWYGGNDPTGFINYVDYIHNLYGKPVQITEFAPADWSGNHGISAQQAYDFMKSVIPQLNARSYVQRYSWFSASTTDAALGQAALYNADGSLTTLGKLYSRL